MKEERVMKKRVKKIVSIVIVILLTLMTNTAHSQIFLMDFDQGENPREPCEDMWLVIPIEGLEGDQYVPIGDSILLLASLGGAYLLTKKKKKD